MSYATHVTATLGRRLLSTNNHHSLRIATPPASHLPPLCYPHHNRNLYPVFTTVTTQCTSRVGPVHSIVHSIQIQMAAGGSMRQLRRSRTADVFVL